MSLEKDALAVIGHAIASADPYESTIEILRTHSVEKKDLCVMSIGKAAIPMAQAAADFYGDRIKTGLVVTKYEHTGDFSSPYFEVIEAAHPISDDNSALAAQKALDIAYGLGENDACIVLLSGGGSALLEKSTLPAELQREITKKLLSRGAPIDDINAVRKRISLVKGGRLAAACYPARVMTVALSDVLSNDKGVIASGITVPDTTPAERVRAVTEKYIPEHLTDMQPFFEACAPVCNDDGYYFAGDINSLCDAAEKKAVELGYSPVCLTRALTGEASEVASRLCDEALKKGGKMAYICGGETTVTLKGDGLGGRNQEMALAAAIRLRGVEDIVFASAGSDGTDGPTDAAGGVITGETFEKMTAAGLSPEAELENNNSYHTLKKVGALIVTGPTGTNVNDITVVLRR